MATPLALPDQATPEAAALLRWYDRNRRTMPWRAAVGQPTDPYRVWLSEIMLQQTTVVTVKPHFERFVARFPTVAVLAAAPTEAVMEAWAGLGYYARARNLHECAKRLAAAGRFPETVAELRALPGIGVYTAAAVASIAFGVPVVPVDGNVERVTARISAITEPLPAGKARIAAAANALGCDADARARPGDFTQALFDLGATICTPRKPSCFLCPWAHACRGRLDGNPERLPIQGPRKLRPVRHGAHFWLQDRNRHVLLRRRPAEGLLGGMLELPGTVWRAAEWGDLEAVAAAPQPAEWRPAGVVKHVFTHFTLYLKVFAAEVPEVSAPGLPHAVDSLEGAALPSIMRRCAAVAVSQIALGVSSPVNGPAA